MSAAHSNVIRDGERQSIPATEPVPGDIIVIAEGDTIPADARLIESVALQTAEAAPTGESLPVNRGIAMIGGTAELGDRHNMIFSGTTAVYGHGCAVVTATGMRTEVGRIADLLQAAPDETTPLQRELYRIGRVLAVTVVLIAVAMIGTIFLVSDIRNFSQVFEVLLLGVALAVAAVPEGLPAVVTAVLSIGMQLMAKKNAIIRRLSAVEALGSSNLSKSASLCRFAILPTSMPSAINR
jgi:Ca2+-transporting ATPase